MQSEFTPAQAHLLAAAIIKRCAELPSFTNGQRWRLSRRGEVATSITTGTSRLDDFDWDRLHTRCSQALPPDWKEVSQFYELDLDGPDLVNFAPTGSRVDNLKAPVVEMVIAIAWAYKASRGEADPQIADTLKALADWPQCRMLLDAIDTRKGHTHLIRAELWQN